MTWTTKVPVLGLLLSGCLGSCSGSPRSLERSVPVPDTGCGGGADSGAGGEDTGVPGETGLAEDTAPADTAPADTGGSEEGPPEPTTSADCPGGVLATWVEGEISVRSWDAEPGSGGFDVAEAGRYHVYAAPYGQSGANQTNESAFYRVPGAADPEGHPVYSNCPDDYVVTDPDNGGDLPADTAVYLGTFDLEAGRNTLEIWHYCWIYRAGRCTGLEEAEPASSDCRSSGPNSVHVEPQQLCLVPDPAAARR